MKKSKLFVLGIAILFLLMTSSVKAENELVNLWKSEDVSNLYSEELVKVDDGYLIGGYNDDYVAEITKVDSKGNQINHYTIDNQFTVVGIGEHDEKYYAVVLDDNYYISIYVFDSDLKLVNSINTKYYLIDWNDVISFNDDEIAITSLGFNYFEGVADSNDTEYLLMTIDYDLEDIKTEDREYGVSSWSYSLWSENDLGKLLNYYDDEYYYLFRTYYYGNRYQNFDSGGIPIDVSTNGDITVLVGKNNSFDLTGTYIVFYDSDGNVINSNYITDISWWYTESAIVGDYVYVIGNGYYQVDVYDLEGNKVKSINLKDAYEEDDDELYLSVDRIIPDNNGFTVTYTICDIVNDCPTNCREAIARYGITFNVYSKTDGHGTINVLETASEGDEVTFTITPEEGYVLGSVKVTDSDGNVVTFTSNTFTMPSADVTIEATFVVENPNTRDMAIICVGLIGIILLICVMLNIKKLKWLS